LNNKSNILSLFLDLIIKRILSVSKSYNTKSLLVIFSATITTLFVFGCSSNDKCSYDAVLSIRNTPDFDSIALGLSLNHINDHKTKNTALNNDGSVKYSPHLDAYRCGSSTDNLFKPKAFYLILMSNTSHARYICTLGNDAADVNGEFVAWVDFNTQCNKNSDE
jgi:hypothetical protein